MTITERSLETLIDLVEIKLSCMEVWDRDDRRELSLLEQARQELMVLNKRGVAASAEVVAIAKRGRGRPPKSAGLGA